MKDNGGTAGGGVDLDQTPNTLTVNVTPVNDAPSAVVLSNVHGPFPENTSTAARIKVADIAVTDVDGGTNILSLSGADASLFQLIGSTLWLKAGATLDFETNPLLNVNVNVNDPTVGGPIDATKALAIAVTDIAENISGTARADRLIGTNNGETIIGLGGNDGIYGNAGNDRIIGGPGADYMTGGPATTSSCSIRSAIPHPANRAMVNNGSFSPAAGHGLRDIITDFTRGQDRLDLSAIDANNQVGGNQAFTFLGQGHFHHHLPGELIYRLYDFAGTAHDKTIVYGDVNGDGRADFQIELTGLKALTPSDFVL